jgi:hypothetical protein
MNEESLDGGLSADSREDTSGSLDRQRSLNINPSRNRSSSGKLTPADIQSIHGDSVLADPPANCIALPAVARVVLVVPPITVTRRPDPHFHPFLLLPLREARQGALVQGPSRPGGWRCSGASVLCSQWATTLSCCRPLGGAPSPSCCSLRASETCGGASAWCGCGTSRCACVANLVPIGYSRSCLPCRIGHLGPYLAVIHRILAPP